jgi:ribose transport system permease protein
MKKTFTDYIKEIKPIVWMLLGVVVFFSLATNSFFSLSNFQNILMQSAGLLIIACGQTVVVLTQGTDLSLGAQVSLVTIVWIILAIRNVPLWLGAIICVLLMIVVGTVNGLVVSKGKLPPFIATLGMKYILNSASLLLAGGASVYYASSFYTKFSKSNFLFLPIPFWTALVMLITTYIVLHRTKTGANIYAIGGNVEALAVAGIKVSKAHTKAYVYAGIMGAIGGLVTACRVASGQPTVGDGMEFNAVAAVLLGGTRLREGEGDVTGTIFGVWYISVIKNGLTLIRLQSIYHQLIIGSMVVIAIVVDAVVSKIGREKARKLLC